MTPAMMLDVDVRVAEYGPDRVLTLLIPHAVVEKWEAGLEALKSSAAASLLVASRNSPWKLEVRVDPSLDVSQRARSDWLERKLRLSLTSTELDYWSHFFQVYLRQGYGDVDHLDVETVSVTGHPDTTVVLKVERCQESVSETEARRRLGM